MKSERQRGFDDAGVEVASMLSCPRCYAKRWLEACPPGSPATPYTFGWRLRMLGVRRAAEHTCTEAKEKNHED